MKSKFIFIFAFSIIFIAACDKNDMMNDSLGVDTEMHYKKLANDYSNASYYHNILGVSGSSIGEHDSHHPGVGNTTTIDTSYIMMMFNANDSLFSMHFFEFCIDMMQNSGMMGTSNGMMGRNGGMMGGGNGMMNGTSMGNITDMNAMMNFMDSLRTSTQTMMNPDYIRTDSLMYDQLNRCKMMVTQTDSIENVFNKMQTLRVNHRSMHGKWFW